MNDPPRPEEPIAAFRAPASPARVIVLDAGPGAVALPDTRWPASLERVFKRKT